MRSCKAEGGAQRAITSREAASDMTQLVVFRVLAGSCLEPAQHVSPLCPVLCQRFIFSHQKHRMRQNGGLRPYLCWMEVGVERCLIPSLFRTIHLQQWGHVASSFPSLEGRSSRGGEKHPECPQPDLDQNTMAPEGFVFCMCCPVGSHSNPRQTLTST